MTNAVSPVQSYGFRYDEENRIIGVAWTSNSTVKIIANKYDGLGRRISRTINGVETRYTLTVLGDMERILCDYSGSTPASWYVHGPDLCFKVDSTNGLTCFLADAIANVIATTDASANFISKYAFSPYGRMLGSSGSTNNPYKFVGGQGVMEELPDIYFMRARYFSGELGIFLSTDPVKKIGPKWRSIAYAYVDGNPLNFLDAQGTEKECAYLCTRPLSESDYIAGGLSQGIAQSLATAPSWLGNNPVSGALNVGLYHEQWFIGSGSENYGLGFDGKVFSYSDPKEKNNGFTCAPTCYDASIVRENIKTIGDQQYFIVSEKMKGLLKIISGAPLVSSLSPLLNLLGNVPGQNCQDWAEKMMNNPNQTRSQIPNGKSINAFQTAQTVNQVQSPATQQAGSKSASMSGGGGGLSANPQFQQAASQFQQSINSALNGLNSLVNAFSVFSWGSSRGAGR